MIARSLVFGAALAAPLIAQVDPTKAPVPLPCVKDWNAFLVHDAGAGVWTVDSFQVWPRFACPEIVALDDKGHCTVLLSYSGKWTPYETVSDGKWLAPVAHADVDPRRAGPELYAGGQRGRVYEIHPRPGGGFDTAIIAEFAGDEVHTLVAGDLRPSHRGEELLAFTGKGRLIEIVPGPRGFAAVDLAKLPGRVRDAIVLPPEPGRPPRIATVSRAGRVELVALGAEGVERETVLHEPMGFGRIATAPGARGRVLYVTRDDGLILRLERGPAGWKREVVFAGPLGARGVVAGRFCADPARESIAVFGYSKKVQLLSRAAGEPWKVETIFTDTDKGHWLTVAELDGRNTTREIVGSGYSGRVFMLARPPGYGLTPVEKQAKHD